MAITPGEFTTEAKTTASTSITLVAPANLVAGDLLYMQASLNGGLVNSAPSGWTQRVSNTGVANPRVFAYSKVAVAADVGATFIFGLNSSITSGAVLRRYSGVDNTTPHDITAAVLASGAAATSGTVGSVTTNTVDALLLGGMGINSSSTAITAPTGMTETAEVGGKKHEADFEQRPAAGGTGTRTWTFGASREFAGFLDALRASAGTSAAQTVTPTGFVDASAVGGPTVTTKITVNPTTFTDVSAVGSPTVIPGPVTVQPTGLTDPGSLGTPAISTKVTVNPTGIVDGNLLGSPTVTSVVKVTPTGFTDPTSLGSPSISTKITITPTTFTDTSAVGAPIVVSGGTVISPTGFSDPGAIGSPAVSVAAVNIVVNPNGIPSQEAVGSATVTPGPVIVTPTGFVDASVIGSPSITVAAGAITVYPVGISLSSRKRKLIFIGD